MSIELDPAELSFKRPFTREVAETLRLKNTHSDPVAFKVKTTAPKKYAVRPNSGRIEPGEVVEVQVLLQAMKEDPADGEKCRDKFLVQSLVVTTEHDSSNISTLWSSIESSAKSTIQEKKIRVNWLSAYGAGADSSIATPSRHLSHLDDTQPSYNTPTTNMSMHSVNATPVGPADSINDRPAGAKHTGDAKADALTASSPSTGGQQSTIGAAISSITNALPSIPSVTSAIPTSSDELKSQLTAAQEQISKLTQQVQDQGLRQRKTEAVKNDATERISTGTTGMGTQQAAPTGVPVPITAALCLLSFLLAYLLF